MRVQQRKLFLDFAEKFSLPANGPGKKEGGGKKTPARRDRRAGAGLAHLNSGP